MLADILFRPAGLDVSNCIVPAHLMACRAVLMGSQQRFRSITTWLCDDGLCPAEGGEVLCR